MLKYRMYHQYSRCSKSHWILINYYVLGYEWQWEGSRIRRRHGLCLFQVSKFDTKFLTYKHSKRFVQLLAMLHLRTTNVWPTKAFAHKSSAKVNLRKNFSVHSFKRRNWRNAVSQAYISSFKAHNSSLTFVLLFFLYVSKTWPHPRSHQP